MGIALILACSHCKPGPTQSDSSISATKVWSQKAGQIQDPNRKTLEFGIGPWYTAEETNIYTRPVLNYLEEQTGYRFILNITDTYEELVTNFQNQHLDVADLSASLYDQLLRNDSHTSQYLGTNTSKVGDKMSSHYRGIIFTHKNSDIRRLEDLKGRTFAFVDQGSSSGFKYPLVTLVKAGIEPKRDFTEIFYVGNHDAVANSVAGKKVAAGAIWDLELENAEKVHGKIFRRLAQTSPIPREAWISQKSLPAELTASIQKALASLKPETKLKSGQPVFSKKAAYNGFTVESEEFYKVVGETSNIVQRYLKKYPNP